MPRPIKRILSRDRLRAIPATGFGWIDRRLVLQGLLSELPPDEALLYFFLCTVADREGLSFYGDRRICSSIPSLTPDSLDRARRNLEHRGLILYRSPIYQVLALPAELSPAPRRHTDPRSRPSAQTGSTAPRSLSDILRDHQRS
jgi:hypothetical protein